MSASSADASAAASYESSGDAPSEWSLSTVVASSAPASNSASEWIISSSSGDSNSSLDDFPSDDSDVSNYGRNVLNGAGSTWGSDVEDDEEEEYSGMMERKGGIGALVRVLAVLIVEVIVGMMRPRKRVRAEV